MDEPDLLGTPQIRDEDDVIDVGAYGVADLRIDEMVPDDRASDPAPTTPRRNMSPQDLDTVDGLSPPRENEANRPRALELTSTLRVIPHIDYSYREHHGLHSELDTFFWLRRDLDQFLQNLAPDPASDSYVTSRNASEYVNEYPRSRKKLLYFALGDFVAVRSLADHQRAIKKNIHILLDAGLLPKLDPTSDDYTELCLFFVCTLVGSSAIAGEFHELKTVQTLMKQISTRRWENVGVDPLLGTRIALLRMVLLSVFGSSKEKNRAQQFNYHKYGLQKENEEKDEAEPASVFQVDTTPLEYETFRQSIMLRYPSYMPPDSKLPGNIKPALSSLTDLSKKQVAPTASVPAIPASIEEACRLFESRLHTTPELVQLWRENEPFMQAVIQMEGANSTDHRSDYPASLDRVDTVYSDTLLHVKSFVTVLANYILSEGMSEDQPAGLHAACGVLRLLLDWYKLSHILKYEFLCAMLFDLQFHLITYKFCARHPILEYILRDVDGESGFWSASKNLSRSKQLSPVIYGFRTEEPSSTSSHDAPTEGVRIERFSKCALDTFISMVGITRSIITDKTQRIIIVAEMPGGALKQLMAVYNHDLWQEVLHIFKLQTPFNGKKWRCMNMELISAIYLHCTAKLNDEWLAGTDLLNEIKSASFQEEALRELIETYNLRFKERALLAQYPELSKTGSLQF